MALTFALTASLTFAAGGGTTYYVSPTGSDAAGNGTENSPWQTLGHAAAQVTTAGDTIFLTAGTYPVTAQVSIAPGVNLTGAGRDSTTVTSSLSGQYANVAAVNVVSAANTNGDQAISGITFDGNDMTGDWALNIVNRNHVEVHDCAFVDFHYVAVGWQAAGTGGNSGWEPPATYVTGGKFYNNITTNCAGYQGGYYRGALFCGGIYDFEIYNNTMIETGRATGQQGWPIKFWYYAGWMVDCKIHDNHLEKTDTSAWTFAIESACHAGMEIYNNTILGSVDLNYSYKSATVNGTQRQFTYATYIHDNVFGPEAAIQGSRYQGVLLELGAQSNLIENNTFRYCEPALYMIPRANGLSDITFRYNTCMNTPAGSWNHAVMLQGSGVVPYGQPVPYEGWTAGTPMDVTNVNIYGNVFHGTGGGCFGLEMDQEPSAHWAGNGVNIRDNIFANFGWGSVVLRYFDTLSNANVTGNRLYNGGQVWAGDKLNDAIYVEGGAVGSTVANNTAVPLAGELVWLDVEGRVAVMVRDGDTVEAPCELVVTQMADGAVMDRRSAQVVFTEGYFGKVFSFGEGSDMTYTYAVALKPGEGDALRGDVDQDGAVTLSDAILLARFLVGIGTSNSTISARGDVNGDGFINVTDVLRICQHLAGLYALSG